MVQIANTSATVQRLTAKDGSVVEIEPGKSAPVEIDRDNIRVEAKRRAGLIGVGGTAAQARRVAREGSPLLEDTLPANGERPE